MRRCPRCLRWHGLRAGSVSGLAFWEHSTERSAASFSLQSSDIGCAVLHDAEPGDFSRPIWMWLRADQTFGLRAIADLGLHGVVLPMGRIDRGLGAYRARPVA